MKKFIIVGTPRTGSTLLQQLINFHPNIACGWQWTVKAPWHRKIEVAGAGLRGKFASLPANGPSDMEAIFTSNIACLGFRALFRASTFWALHPRIGLGIWADRLEGYRGWIKRNPDIYIIHVVRNNDIEWLRSYVMSKRTRVYIGAPYPKMPAVVVPKKEALRRIASKNWINHRLQLLQETNPYFRIEYESMCLQKEATGLRICDFFGLNKDRYMFEEKKLIPKQATGAACESIANCEELESVVARTGYHANVTR